MGISNYQNGFPNGLVVRGVPLIDMQNSAGRTFWVDSNKSSAGDSNSGSFEYPLKTLRAAIAKCRSYQSDKIFLAAGHSEELTSEFIITKQGIQIIGLGVNNNRPQIIIISHLAFIQLKAADVYIGNIDFTGDVPETPSLLESIITIYREGTYIENCYFRGVNEIYHPHTFILLRSDMAEVADKTTISFCRFETRVVSPSPVMDSAIFFQPPLHDVHIHSCKIIGTYETACIRDNYTFPNPFSENIVIDGENYFYNQLDTLDSYAIRLDGTNSGFVSKDTIAVNNNPITHPIRIGGRAGRGIAGDVEFLIYDIPYVDLAPAEYRLTSQVRGTYKVEQITFETDSNGIAAVGVIQVMKIAEQKARGSTIMFASPITGIFTPLQTINLDTSTNTISNRPTLTTGAEFRVHSSVVLVGTGSLRLTIKLRKVLDATFHRSRFY